MRAGAAVVTLAGESVELLAERALFWPRARTLFVADVHLGKAAAFRAGGVAIPRGATANDLARLDALIERTAASRLVVLGDFLHAAAGRVPALHAAFTRWRAAHAPLSITLVRGNHDLRAGDPPPAWDIEVVRESAPAGAFRALPRTGDAAYWTCTVRARASGRAHRCRPARIRPAAVLRPRAAAHPPPGLRTTDRARDRRAEARRNHRRHRRIQAVRAARPTLVAWRPGHRPAWCRSWRQVPRIACRKTATQDNRSSAGLPVDNPVNVRWNMFAYPPNRAAMGCFCCRFSTPRLCIKKGLPSAGLPTMLCAHQALQHKM